MKKILIFFIIVIIIVAIISGMYINYKFNTNIIKRKNLEYEYYLDKKISGTELATLINKAVNDNEKNNVEKDEQGKYSNNNKNSINIKIRFTDNEKTYSMESIYQGQITNFINYYGNINFECTEVEYHKNTNKISYMCFQQVKEN